MPAPKYRIIPVWDSKTAQWVTQVSATRGGKTGIEVLAEIDPDAQFTYEYQIEDPATHEMVTKTKTDWVEKQTFFVPNGITIATIISSACWNHYDTLTEKVSQVIPDPPAPIEYNALPK